MKIDSQRKQQIIVAGIILVVLIISSLPYLYAYLNTHSGFVFIGTRSNNRYDFPTYISWIEQARQGHLVFKDLFSSESQAALYFHPLFLAIGLGAKLFHVSSVLSYQVARIILGGLLLVMGYIFTGLYYKDFKKRIGLFLFFALASGLGWLWGNRSVDIIQSEATNFLTLYESVINTSALLLLLSVFYLFLRTPWSSKFRWFAMIFATILLVLVHGYDVFTLFVVLGVYSGITYVRYGDESYLRTTFFLGISAVPALIWQLYVLKQNTALGIWAVYQTSVPAQQPLSYLATYGLLVLFALVGLIFGEQKISKTKSFLFCWLVVSLALLFNPFSHRFQQKLSLGLFTPLILLAAMGVLWWMDQLSGVWKYRYTKHCIYAFVLTLLFYTNFFVVVEDIHYYNEYTKPLYISSGGKAALDWFKQFVSDKNIILSSYGFGNLLPAFTGRTVYLGHYDQTVDFKYKYQLVPLLMAAQPNYTDPLKKFVQDEHISYIVVDEEARSWGVIGYSDRSYLESVYKNSDVEIYKVK